MGDNSSLWPRRFTAIFGAAGAGIVAWVFGACSTNVRSFAPSQEPITHLSQGDYQTLLDRYVGENGKVEYGRWKDSADDVHALDAYLSMLTHATPDTRLDLFKTPTDKLSYWINLYNALVLREIIRRWPLDSVTDVKVDATSFVKQGKGFFYDLKFLVGGQEMNLYDLENKIIRVQFKDARIHFAINCGSTGCPLLRKDAFDSQLLEGQLEAAAVQFVNDGKNVRVEHGTREVVMSKIFEWYQGDFAAFTMQRAKLAQPSVIDFALLYAQGDLAANLKDAKAKGYAVRFLDYDWSVNKQDAAGSKR